MKKLFAAAAFILASSNSYAACEGVNLNELDAQLEKIIDDGDMSTEIQRFEQQIVGSKRLCTKSLYQAYKAKKKISPAEEKIAIKADTILNPPKKDTNSTGW